MWKIIRNIPPLEKWLDYRRKVFIDVGKAIAMLISVLNNGGYFTPQLKIFVRETLIKVSRFRFIKRKITKDKIKRLKDLLIEVKNKNKEDYKKFLGG